MKPERSFVAERALAQHCPELFGRGKAGGVSGEPLAAFARFGTALARDLAQALAPLLGIEELCFAAPVAVEGDPAFLAEQIAPLAANSLLAIGSEGTTMLVSIDAATVFAAIDRTFGGKGEIPSPLPAAFAPSSEIMARRLTARIAAVLAQALGLAADALRPLRCESRLAALEPFAEGAALALLTLVGEQAGQPSCSIRLAVPVAAFEALLGDKPRAPRRPGASAPDAQPWCDLPLTLSAVLVDMRLPVSALAGLRPDAILPVSVARQVPLRVGGRTLAHGSVGSLDDRVAIQITQAF